MSEWTFIGKTALLVIHMQNAICRAPSPLEFRRALPATRRTASSRTSRICSQPFAARVCR